MFAESKLVTFIYYIFFKCHILNYKNEFSCILWTDCTDARGIISKIDLNNVKHMNNIFYLMIKKLRSLGDKNMKK